MDVYARLFERVLLPVWETRVRRRPTLAIWKRLDESQLQSREQLIEDQLSALRALLTHAAAHVPFYAARMQAADIQPSAIRSLDDLHRLPRLTRDDARDAGDLRCSTVPPFASIKKATSGSSGQPLAFAYDETSEHWRQAAKLRGYAWAGVRPGMSTVHYWGAARAARKPSRVMMAKQRAKVSLDRFARREHYIDCSARSDEALTWAAKEIARIRPQALVCFAQAGADLARHVAGRGLRDWPDIRVICGGEALLPADRAVMQRAFGAEIFESYGSREVMLMAMECEAHDGLHVAMENVLVEVVVREDGRERHARPGEVGEVLVTDLHNYGMPFIRYANGDLATAGPEEPCACGRGLVRIQSVDGRVTQAMRDARGGTVGGLLVCSVVAHVGEAVKAFQTVQHKDGSVTLNVVPTAAFDDATRRHLIAALEPYFEGLPLQVRAVSDIPAAPNGKRPIIVVEA